VTRVLYDGITASNIPLDAQMVAGYDDGLYRWSAADWARFPNAVKIHIAVFASDNESTVLDVEPGDATPAQAPGWVNARRAGGVDPTVYCSLSSWPVVRGNFQNQRVAEPHYWIAAYPGIGGALYAGSVAHQYADPGPYDLSVVADNWPGVDLTPIPITIVVPAAVTERHGEEMLTPVPVPTDPQGNGWAPTTIPWAKWNGACTLQGGNPPKDGYWPGLAKATDLGEVVLVQVTGALPNTVVRVFIGSSP
jgi:hypothetical protein